MVFLYVCVGVRERSLWMEMYEAESTFQCVIEKAQKIEMADDGKAPSVVCSSSSISVRRSHQLPAYSLWIQKSEKCNGFSIYAHDQANVQALWMHNAASKCNRPTPATGADELQSEIIGQTFISQLCIYVHYGVSRSRCIQDMKISRAINARSICDWMCEEFAKCFLLVHPPIDIVGHRLRYLYVWELLAPLITYRTSCGALEQKNTFQ